MKKLLMMCAGLVIATSVLAVEALPQDIVGYAQDQITEAMAEINGARTWGVYNGYAGCIIECSNEYRGMLTDKAQIAYLGNIITYFSSKTIKPSELNAMGINSAQGKVVTDNAQLYYQITALYRKCILK